MRYLFQAIIVMVTFVYGVSLGIGIGEEFETSSDGNDSYGEELTQLDTYEDTFWDTYEDSLNDEDSIYEAHIELQETEGEPQERHPSVFARVGNTLGEMTGWLARKIISRVVEIVDKLSV